MSKWYDSQYPDTDIFISSQIRYARNIENYNFVPKLNEKSAVELVEQVKGILPKIAKTNEERQFFGCNLRELSDLDRNALMEKHIISPGFAKRKQTTGLILSADEGVSICINDQDHLRIRVVHGGNSMEKVLKEINSIDDAISEEVKYAFDEKLGYLTSCPTNVGTGMRATYLLFLPALSVEEKIPQIIEEVGKYGINFRGIFGENGKSAGSLYQISNQKTLGYSEEEIVSNLNRMTMQIAQEEKKHREYILAANGEEWKDRVHRAYGILKYATSMSSQEAMQLLSEVKFGIDTGLLTLESEVNIYPMILNIRPCNIQWKLSKMVGKNLRDRLRADYLREHLPELKVGSE